jgi:hypothetical protein
LAGAVVDENGRAVAGALVSLHGLRDLEARSLDDGSFGFAGLEPGEYLAFASIGERASEALGPIPLAAGEDLRGLTLVVEPGSWFEGTVRSQPEGTPLAGAVLSAGAASAVSDGQGRYRLQGLPSGRLVMHARAEGHLPRDAEVELPRRGGREGGDLYLDRAARVRGTVRASGAPIAGIEVAAARYGVGARLSETTPIATSGEQGRFEGWLPPGRLQIVARGGGWAEARTEELEVVAGEELEVYLDLGPGGAVFGSVRDGARKPQTGCQVQAFDATHGRVVSDSLTGPSGEYWISAVPQSIYVLVASCAAGRSERSGIAVVEGAQVQIDLVLGDSSLAGRVAGPSGEPVSGAAISVRAEGSAADAAPVARSGADGRFQAQGLSGERFTIIAKAREGEAELSGVPAGSTDVVLSLGAGELHGVVVGDRGDPVADFVVYAEPAVSSPGKARSQRFLSPTGEFRLAIAPGLYEVRAGAPGYASSESQAASASATEATAVRLALSRGHEVVGKVVDEQGTGIQGAGVATNPNMLWAYGRAAPVPSGAFATTDAQGTFRLRGVAAASRVWLIAHKEGFKRQARRVVVPGEASGIVLVLTRDDRSEREKEFAGVGMSLYVRDGRVLVVDVFEAGPARAAGIRQGDELLAVDGVPTAGQPLEAVIGSIRGLVGTAVELQLARDGRSVRVAVARASIKF